MNLPRIAQLLENKNDMVINDVILSSAQKKSQVIYGARAYNIQSPDHLKKKTTDYDILTCNPKKAAQETAEKLRQRLGKKVEVVKGSHKGTYRVKLDNEVVVDYTQLKRKQKTKNSWGIKVRTLKSIKRNAQRLVKNPKTEYRRTKDLDTLQRIQEIERIDKAFSF